MEKENEKCEYCGEDLETIKEEYLKFQKKYSLPDFKSLNENFDISKIDCCNNETLLRDIRKTMIAKFGSILQFVELLLNPSNGSMFHMFLVKGIGNGEKESLNKLFEILGVIQIDSFELDIIYDEEKEAEFIKSTYKSWDKVKPELEKIINSLKNNWRKVTGKKSKSYFG